MKNLLVFLSLINSIRCTDLATDLLPSNPPSVPPITCENYNSSFCDNSNPNIYFDINCYSSNDLYGNLGCNAGGISCCRYCEFGPYINITCIESPNMPPSPPHIPPIPISPPYPPSPPISPPPPLPPHSPLPCRNNIPNYCDDLVERNYFDTNCYSYNDAYGNLGCNAGGLKCCRFCGFGNYINISCIESPNIPPSPSPPKNPLIIPMEDISIKPEKSKIEFNIRIASTIETFDRRKFKRNLRSFFKKPISLSNIILRIRAGSLIVDVIIITNTSSVQNMSNIINNVNPEIFGIALNISIIEMSSPTIINYDPAIHDNTIDINSSQLTKKNFITDPINIFIVCVLIIICFCIARMLYKNHKKQNAKKIVQKNKLAELSLGHLDGVSSMKSSSTTPIKNRYSDYSDDSDSENDFDKNQDNKKKNININIGMISPRKLPRPITSLNTLSASLDIIGEPRDSIKI